MSTRVVSNCDLGSPQELIIRDVFIANMQNWETPLLRETQAAKKALDIAIIAYLKFWELLLTQYLIKLLILQLTVFRKPVTSPGQIQTILHQLSDWTAVTLGHLAIVKTAEHEEKFAANQRTWWNQNLDSIM